MSPELVLYYEHKSIQSISDACGVSRKAMTSRLIKQRKKLEMMTRGRGATHVSDDMMEFIADRNLIIELAKSGMNFLDIANKWDIDERTVSKYLGRWGMVIDANVDVESISLIELYTGWAEIPQGKEMFLTVNKKPMLKVVWIL